AASDHEISRGELDQPAVLVIFRLAGNGADLVEGAGIEQLLDALAHGQLAGIVLALDLLLATHLARQRLARPQFIDFRLPAHLALLLPRLAVILADKTSGRQSCRDAKSRPRSPAQCGRSRRRSAPASRPRIRSCCSNA